MGIKAKLIILFIVLKVVPLVFIAVAAITAAKNLGIIFEKDSVQVIEDSSKIIKQTADTAIGDSIKALDKKSQESLEIMTVQIAQNIARFLRGIDGDLLFLSGLEPDEKTYKYFIDSKKKEVTIHGEYFYDDNKKDWIAKQERLFAKSLNESAQLKDNKEEFNKRELPNISKIPINLYKEISFVGLDGTEKIKISKINSQKKDISDQNNTYLKAENYFQELQNLSKGQIYVSSVIGEYVGSKIIGSFTKEKALKAKIEFEPSAHGYAGVENPIGKKFDGIIRFATPLYQEGEKIGYITLALDHIHLREFTAYVYPNEKYISDIADAQEGNYAFVWDNLGRSIVHPRDYSIVGFNKETGKYVAPWIDAELKTKFDKSGFNDLNDFLSTISPFEEQGLHKKPNMEQIAKGEVALDCRYLNFAPQCQGWFQLVKDGGYGSFMIQWSGLLKLTTAAAIPYYTGQYGKSKIGFGFVTIGANVDEFRSAALNTKKNIDLTLQENINAMNKTVQASKNNAQNGVSDMIREVSIVTGVLIIIVIFIAIIISENITRKIYALIDGAKAFSQDNLDYKIQMDSQDEFGKLAKAFNSMAESIKIVQKSKQEALNNLIYNIAHQWRQPLNVISLTTQDIKEAYKFGDLNEKYLNTSVDEIMKNTSYLSSLIDKFKSFLFGSTANQYFDSSAAITQTIELAQSELDAKNIKMDIQLEPKIFVSGAENDFKQAILSMVENSKEALEKISGDKKLSIILKKVDNMAIYEICDNAGGIKDEIKDKIFEPYFSTKFKSQGAGLGLYMVKSIIEKNMDGRISFSNIKNGCCFKIYMKLEKNDKNISK